jgi:hypothetical protein
MMLSAPGELWSLQQGLGPMDRLRVQDHELDNGSVLRIANIHVPTLGRLAHYRLVVEPNDKDIVVRVLTNGASLRLG